MNGFGSPRPIDDLLFRLERELAEGRIVASSSGFLIPEDQPNADISAAIQAMLIINHKSEGHKRIKRLVLRYAALQGRRG